MLNGDAHTVALGGTTSEAGQMGAMASEPDLVHDVSYDQGSSPTMSMPELPGPTGSLTANSQVSLATSSTGGDASVSPKRQLEFERYFRDQLALAGDRVGPDDLTVVATQSADLQAKILIHGRLYLTPSYLCFRANILGFKTEKIHRIRDMVVVEKSTTAKWIQNAVSITMEKGEQGETPENEDDTTGRVFGYGSMADRDAMYEQLASFWKQLRPERFEQHQRKRAESVARRAAATRDEELDPIKEDVDGAEAKDTASDSGSETADEATGAKETKDSGERYKETALDVKLPVKPLALFNLIYHNDEFLMDFLKNVQQLTDVEVSDWKKSTEGMSRGLTYVMHMNNKIGPSKSDCIGEEIIVVEDPEKAFEIKSSTQTPDVPSGKSFKIHTRTCITHSPVRGRPGSQLFCTTQCDWLASSWLKSTITPATMSGQREYHQKLLKAIKKWIKAHPKDFEVAEGQNGGDGGETAGEETDMEDDTENKGVGASVSSTGEGQTIGQDDGVWEQVMAIPANPVMLGITLLCAVSLLLNYYLLFRSGGSGKVDKAVIVPAPPREL